MMSGCQKSNKGNDSCKKYGLEEVQIFVSTKARRGMRGVLLWSKIASNMSLKASRKKDVVQKCLKMLGYKSKIEIGILFLL